MKRAITIVLVGTTAASLAASVWSVRANSQTRLGGTTGAMFPAYQATFLSSSQLINPEELVKILQAPKGEKPLMIQVGSHVLYAAGAYSRFRVHRPCFQRERHTAAA